MRHRDFRHSQRREFDADTYNPQPRFSQTFEALSDPPVYGLVKWFSPEKGFGFVELSDGSGDAFLHGSVLAQSGIDAVQPGDTVEVQVGPGHTGPHVTQVLGVDSSTAAPATPLRSGFRSATSGGRSSGTSVQVTGTVKWFSVEKGYGFITRSSGGDVFVHISALERPGLRASTKEITFSSMSPRAARGRKPRRCGWSKIGPAGSTLKAGAGV